MALNKYVPPDDLRPMEEPGEPLDGVERRVFGTPAGQGENDGQANFSAGADAYVPKETQRGNVRPQRATFGDFVQNLLNFIFTLDIQLLFWRTVQVVVVLFCGIIVAGIVSVLVYLIFVAPEWLRIIGLIAMAVTFIVALAALGNIQQQRRF